MIYVIYLVILKLANANDIVTSKLIDEAVYLATRYYSHQFVTAVMWSDDDSNGVDDFLIKYRGSTVTICLSDINNDAIIDIKQRFQYKQIVVIASGLEDFEKACALINKHIRFPIRLILVLNKYMSELTEISIFFEIAWKQSLADVVIVTKNLSDEIVISTYFPYNGRDCGVIPVMLKPGENIFPNKFNNFNKCPIRISALNIPLLIQFKIENGIISDIYGFEGTVFTIIVNKLNAGLKVTERARYGSYANGTVTDALSDLVHNRSDVVLPGAVLNSRYSITQASHVYYSADMRWIGPKRRQIYQWIKLLVPFLNNITPYLILTFTLFVIVVIIIRKRRKVCRQYNKGRVCFEVFTLLLGQSVNYETKVPLLNNLFLIWIWFCFIIRLTYQGYLVNALQNRILEPPFKTIEGALKTVDGYGGSVGMLEFYKGTPIERNYKIFTSTNMYYEHIDGIIAGERFMLLLDRITRASYRQSIQVLDTPISSTMVCVFMRRDWPAGRAVDTILVRLLEAGIIEKLLNAVNNGTRGEADNDKYTQPLNLLMISSCFCVMSILWLICFIIFLLELLYKRYNVK